MQPATIIGITAALIVLLIFSAFFSSTETAFTGFSQIRMKQLAKTKKSARLALKMSENYNRLLSTLLIGNNIVNIAATTLATMLFVGLSPDYGAMLSTAVMTVTVLIFGEITPKTLARETPEKFAMFAVYPLRVFSIIFFPVVWLFDLWKKLLNLIFRFDKKKALMTEEEFNLMVTDLTEEGVLKVSEKELIQNTIRYDDMTVANSMTKRDGITYVRKGERTESIKRMFLQTNYSRVPVVDGNLDNIIGIMYRADFYEMLLSGHKNVMSIVKPAYFVDSGEKLSAVLKKMQKASQPVALVKNEGKIVGLLAMEDIIEELIGEVQDIYDIVPNDQMVEP